MNPKEMTIVEEIENSLGTLPEDGKVQVFMHLVAELRTMDLKRLSREACRDLLEIMPKIKSECTKAMEAMTLADLQSRRKALIKKHRIEAVGEGKVRLTLNGTPRIEFLLEVQEIASGLYREPAIDKRCLKAWAEDPAFFEKPEKGEIAVDGWVNDSIYKTRAEQEAKGWLNVDMRDVAVAHAAYFLLTGQNLFHGGSARVSGGILSVVCGLWFLADSSEDDCRNVYLHAVAALPPRNG